MRQLSATLIAVKNTKRAHTRLLLDLDIASTLYYVADQTLRYGGNVYEPRLAVDSEIRFRRSLAVDGATVRWENVSLSVSNLLKTEFVQGSRAVLRRLYLEADEAVTVFDGIVADVAIEGATAVIRLASQLDPATQRVPERVYSQLCTWRFKSPECGFVGAPALCNKTFPQCTTYGQTHRFNGFVHITRELQESVPPTPAPEPRQATTAFDWHDPEYDGWR